MDEDCRHLRTKRKRQCSPPKNQRIDSNAVKKQSGVLEWRLNMVKTLKEAEDRIRNAMKPPRMNQGNGFSSKVQGVRQTANVRKPAPQRKQLT